MKVTTRQQALDLASSRWPQYEINYAWKDSSKPTLSEWYGLIIDGSYIPAEVPMAEWRRTIASFQALGFSTDTEKFHMIVSAALNL